MKRETKEIEKEIIPIFNRIRFTDVFIPIFALFIIYLGVFKFEKSVVAVSSVIAIVLYCAYLIVSNLKEIRYNVISLNYDNEFLIIEYCDWNTKKTKKIHKELINIVISKTTFVRYDEKKLSFDGGKTFLISHSKEWGNEEIVEIGGWFKY